MQDDFQQNHKKWVFPWSRLGVGAAVAVLCAPALWVSSALAARALPRILLSDPEAKLPAVLWFAPASVAAWALMAAVMVLWIKNGRVDRSFSAAAIAMGLGASASLGMGVGLAAMALSLPGWLWLGWVCAKGGKA